MKRTTKTIFSLLASGILFVITPVNAFAATINLSPSAGTYPPNLPFSVDLIIDEKTHEFNAAQATVQLSNNLTVTDLVLGNCEFSFVKTPTAQDPSFVGVVLGSSKKSCTLYTLNILPNGSDTGTITITNGSVKRYGDAEELLTAVQFGNYTLGSNTIGSFIASVIPGNNGSNQFVPATANAATISTEQNLENYTVSVKVVDKNNKPIENAIVALKPQLQSTDASEKEVKTNKDGIAEFKAIDPSVYTVNALYDGAVLAEQIINAQGSKPVLTLGLQQEKSEPNIWALIIGGIVLVIATFLLLKTRIFTLFHRGA